MRLIHDGLTQTESIPVDGETFQMTFRPLASYEMQQFRDAKGTSQVDLLLGKLLSWTLVVAESDLVWLAKNGHPGLKAGDPLPISRATLAATPGYVFEVMYMVAMGILTGPDGKTGQQKQAEAVKN